MTKHITLTDSDEPIDLPGAMDLLDLNDALKELLDAFRNEAETNHNPGAWGAVRSLESAVYYVHGAAAWLAKDEGLVP
jgi:hypothetical protein